MRSVEYRIWSPEASSLRVEFPEQLLRGLGLVETSGALYGSRQGEAIRILALGARTENEEQENVGVYVARIRGEVFLTEADLELFNEQQSDVALVVAGDRAGFFVRQADGSIQTVRSHEEFSIAPPSDPNAAVLPRKLFLAPKRAWKWKWAPAGLVTLAALPIAALAVFPQRPPNASSALEVRESSGQLRISWQSGQIAVLTIDDNGSRAVIPVYPNQSNVTYVPRGSEVAVTLTSADGAKQPRSESALYISSAKR